MSKKKKNSFGREFLLTFVEIIETKERYIIPKFYNYVLIVFFFH